MFVHIRCLIPNGKQTANNKLLKVKLGLISSLNDTAAYTNIIKQRNQAATQTIMEIDCKTELNLPKNFGR